MIYKPEKKGIEGSPANLPRMKLRKVSLTTKAIKEVASLWEPGNFETKPMIFRGFIW